MASFWCTKKWLVNALHSLFALCCFLIVLVSFLLFVWCSMALCVFSSCEGCWTHLHNTRNSHSLYEECVKLCCYVRLLSICALIHLFIYLSALYSWRTKRLIKPRVSFCERAHFSEAGISFRIIGEGNSSSCFLYRDGCPMIPNMVCYSYQVSWFADLLTYFQVAWRLESTFRSKVFCRHCFRSCWSDSLRVML